MKLAFFLVMVVLAMTVVPAATASKEDEAKRVAVALVYANVNARYGTVWAYLHPRYQRVTTRAFWESCKRKLAEERGVEFFHIRAIDAYPDRVTLPLLGTTRVIAVTLQAKFVDPHQQGVGMASDTHPLGESRLGMEGVVDVRAVPRLQGSSLPRHLTR